MRILFYLTFFFFLSLPAHSNVVRGFDYKFDVGSCELRYNSLRNIVWLQMKESQLALFADGNFSQPSTQEVKTTLGSCLGVPSGWILNLKMQSIQPDPDFKKNFRLEFTMLERSNDFGRDRHVFKTGGDWFRHSTYPSGLKSFVFRDLKIKLGKCVLIGSRVQYRKQLSRGRYSTGPKSSLSLQLRSSIGSTINKLYERDFMGGGLTAMNPHKYFSECGSSQSVFRSSSTISSYGPPEDSGILLKLSLRETLGELEKGDWRVYISGDGFAAHTEYGAAVVSALPINLDDNRSDEITRQDDVSYKKSQGNNAVNDESVAGLDSSKAVDLVPLVSQENEPTLTKISCESNESASDFAFVAITSNGCSISGRKP